MLEFHTGDCLEWMKGQPADRFDLVFGSPPYEAQRTYGIGFTLQGQAWVDWMVSIVLESLWICRGLVVFVVEGRTKNFRWSATPVLLMADLHRIGVCLRKPPVFCRQGIPGSGGPDFWRNDYEFILCCTRKRGRLPYARPLEIAQPCKYRTGGAFSYRTKDGQRINEQKHNAGSAADRQNQRRRGRPEKTNPGNLIRGSVGGGHMGDDIAHLNEAPFPEWLVELFVRCFAPPNGWVLDPFSGSGTTAAVCQRWGRNCVGVDIRKSQIQLAKKRCAQKMLL